MATAAQGGRRRGGVCAIALLADNSLDGLRAAYDRVVGYIAWARESASADADLSDFWREHLGDEKRRNFPEFDEMLVMRRGFTYPLADRAKVGDRGAERAYAEGAWRVIRPSVPGEWFDQVRESALGCPVAFQLDGHTLSAGGIVNALTAWRIAHWCERTGLADRPLRVLEIGPGYGNVAHQLMQRLDVQTYAVCDLPENLFLGAFYLIGNFPTRSAAFAGRDEDAALNASELAFTVPPLVDRLEGPFDLILNSYSFQEMNRESVESYFELAERILAPDGVFYSFNAHGKSGIDRPADYPVGRFRLESLLPVRRFPWQMFGTVPYEIVMRPRSTGPTLDPDELRFGLNGLGGALQHGLHDELVPLCVAFAEGRADRSALAALDTWTQGGGAAAFDHTGSLSDAVVSYLRGSARLAELRYDAARRELHAAAEGLAESHAAVRCATMLAAVATHDGDDVGRAEALRRAAALAPHLDGDIKRFGEDPESLAAVLASQLSLPAPRPRAPGGRLSRIGSRLPGSAGSRLLRDATRQERNKN